MEEKNMDLIVDETISEIVEEVVDEVVEELFPTNQTGEEITFTEEDEEYIEAVGDTEEVYNEIESEVE